MVRLGGEGCCFWLLACLNQWNPLIYVWLMFETQAKRNVKKRIRLLGGTPSVHSASITEICCLCIPSWTILFPRLDMRSTNVLISERYCWYKPNYLTNNPASNMIQAAYSYKTTSRQFRIRLGPCLQSFF